MHKSESFAYFYELYRPWIKFSKEFLLKIIVCLLFIIIIFLTFGIPSVLMHFFFLALFRLANLKMPPNSDILIFFKGNWNPTFNSNSNSIYLLLQNPSKNLIDGRFFFFIWIVEIGRKGEFFLNVLFRYFFCIVRDGEM